jgi:hypothetical protein
MILLMLMAIELFSRACYYQQLHKHPLATVQFAKDVRDLFRKRLIPDTTTRRVQNDQNLVRPGFSKADNDELARNVMEANVAVYEPWVEFAFRDIRTKYVNVTGHVRRSVPELSDSLAKKPFRIFFLGGSTTYGFNVADEETIPSSFVRAYRQKYPGGRPIQVINLAMPSYYSYQELIQLTDKLFRGDKPDMVIMLDGLNDCYQATASFYREPLYTPGMDGQTHPGDNWQRLMSFFQLPAGMSEDAACNVLYQYYIDNVRHARELTALYSIPLYCFWQPVPYYGYPNRKNDPVCSQDTTYGRFEKIYPLVKRSAGEIPYLFYLGDMLQEEKGLPFIDKVHYSPRFSQVIAEKMLSEIVFKDNK